MKESSSSLSLAEFKAAICEKTRLLWCPLENHRLIRVEGPDADKFLQGQLTCDLHRLHNTNKFGLGAHCNPKGRMISSFAMAKMGENSWVLRIHASIVEYALTALQKYIVFSKANAKLEDQYIPIGLAGARPSSHLRSCLPFPDSDGEIAASENGLSLKHTNNQWELWCHDTELNMLTQTLGKDAQFSDNQWDLLNIRRGHAEVRNHTLEQLLPQEIYLDVLEGVSFKKGCYTGQEIVARMHYKGKLKNHLYMARFHASEEPKPGTPLVHNETGIKCGSLLMSARSDHEQFDGLVICADGAARTNQVSLDTSQYTSNMQWLNLPYAIPGT